MNRRGQRISTSVPFTAVLTSTSADDDPFTFTAPKLLFPPKPSTTLMHPSTPPQHSKFLEALRAASATERKPAAAPVPAVAADKAPEQAALPPTPVTLKRKPTDPALGGPAKSYKKMRGLGMVPEGGLR